MRAASETSARVIVKMPLVGPASVAVALVTASVTAGGEGGALHPGGTEKLAMT